MNDLRLLLCGAPEVPTLIHVTHAKAGSTWMSHLLWRLFGNRCAPRGTNASGGGSLADFVFEQGRVYSAMFMTRDEVCAHPELTGAPRFAVIRDIRDTLVSLYFSLKVTHSCDNKFIESRRDALRSLSFEEGLLHLLGQLRRIALIQRSWIEGDDLVLRYEDLILNPGPTLEHALIDRLNLPVSRPALQRAIRRTHFQSVFKRKLGVEDVNSHGRTGLPGDWRRHFTPEVSRQFVEKFGDLLIASGYETDDRWAA